MMRGVILVTALVALSACSSVRSLEPAQRYDGFLIHFTEGTVFYPCGGHPKLGWRVANEVAILPRLQSFPGHTLGIGNMVYIACTGVRRGVSKAAPNLPVLPYEIHIQQVLELRHARPGDCHAKTPNQALQPTAGPSDV